MATTKHWDPLSFLRADAYAPFNLVILNQPILIKKEIMAHLWNTAALRITVDGAVDRWFDWMGSSGDCSFRNLGLPDIVTGDFDSIRPTTLAMLRKKSVHVIHTADQNFTDFTKAIRCVKGRNASSMIVAVCEASGRLDQILSQLNTLHEFEESIVLLSSCSATWLLRTGSHEIDVSSLRHSDILSDERWIGLFPIGASTIATTSGLKWNLNNQEMKFGGLVSSSNTFGNGPVIKIKTDQPLVCTIGLSISIVTSDKAQKGKFSNT